MPYKKIICATDGSPTAEHAQRVAAAIAKASRAHLILVHGCSHVQGSVSHGVAHHAPCDVLIVRARPFTYNPPSPSYKSIAVATDGSPTADRAARKGLDLARKLGASATLVFVGHPSTGDPVLRDTLDAAGEGMDAKLRVVGGDAADRIGEVAEAERADLIVVGNKGMTGASRFLLGSVPQKVLEHAHCDVLVARTITQVSTEIEKGEGGIVSVEGQKVAVYRNDDGELIAISAKCTHMGCTVGWNSADKTWDCPCHGSRYTPTGEVLNGPAAKPLVKTSL